MEPRTSGEVGARLADEVVASLAKHRDELTTNRGQVQKALKRSCVASAVAALGGTLLTRPVPHSAFDAKGQGLVVAVGGKTIEVHVPVIRLNDAGYADGKLQLGLARAFAIGDGVVDGTVVMAVDHKEHKNGFDAETAKDPKVMAFADNLSQSLRSLGVEWRRIHDDGRVSAVPCGITGSL